LPSIIATDMYKALQTEHNLNCQQLTSSYVYQISKISKIVAYLLAISVSIWLEFELDFRIEWQIIQFNQRWPP